MNKNASEGLPSDKNNLRLNTKTLVPSENANAKFFESQNRAYGNCFQWLLTDAERRKWCETELPLLDMLRVFACGLFVEAHGHSWERSAHNEGILIYCAGGTGSYWQDDLHLEINAGDLLYCPPNTHHGYTADATQPWTIYWIHLSGSMLPAYEKLLGLVDDGPVRHIGIHDAIIAEFTRLIIRHPLTKNSADWFCIQSNAIAILGRIAELPRNIADITAAYGPIQKSIALMNASLDQSFDLMRFAAEAGCGRRHFIRQFRRVTGLPPGEWFTRQKMQRACGLLTLPNIRINEVASRLGYTDALYFSRVFKRSMGVAPESYRLSQTSSSSTKPG